MVAPSASRLFTPPSFVIIPWGFRRNMVRPSWPVEKELEGETEMNGAMESGPGFPERIVTDPEGNVVEKGVQAHIRGTT